MVRLSTIAAFTVAYAQAKIEDGDFDDVRADIRKILPDENFDVGNSIDVANHGPDFIRLAWHCTGSYRTSDGRGGCDGGRIRFNPEKSWGSNKNLDNTLDYLTPIKLKYGSKLSWGDLIVLAGNTAIEAGKGPLIPFCGGRKDDANGFWSEALNNDEIYINPETGDAQGVRESFEIMDMNDRETVALIAGGHAYGGGHTYTSGFDGYWTHDPVKFSNEYVVNLLTKDWKETRSSMGRKQYEADGVFMLPTDIAMKDDPVYLKILQEYADNEKLLKREFGAAWTKLTMRDMGDRPCLGDDPLTIPPQIVDYNHVKAAITGILRDEAADFGHYGGLMVRLTWHCAGTYRVTDHRGGCDGARIRHDPELNWASNAHIDFALSLLEPIKNQFGEGLSWADLIILAGNAALEDMGSKPLPFCPGRTDEENGDNSAYLDPEIYLDAATADADALKESMLIMGFDNQEMTVLNGGGHSIGKMHRDRSGFNGPWTFNPTKFSNEFFQLLLSEEWIPRNDSVTDKPHFTDAETETLTMLHTDIQFVEDPEFRHWVEQYAADENLFKDDFVKAWTKLTNADRFGGVCDTYLQSQEEQCMGECEAQCALPAEGGEEDFCAGLDRFECRTHAHCQFRQARKKCEPVSCKKFKDDVTCTTSKRCMSVYMGNGRFKKCKTAHKDL